MNELKFSVLMSVYYNDNPDHFDTALSSVLINQTIKPDEIVVVLDGSVSDEINAVISKYESNALTEFKAIRLEQNGGLGNALKVGLESCTYDIVARMDSDDISATNRFEQQLKAFNEDTDIIGGDISEFIDFEDNIVSYRKVPCEDKEIKEFLKKRCPFNHMTVMFKKKAVIDAGGYLDLHWNEDYYLWIRMMENNASMKNTGSVLVNVRVGADMYKRRGGRKYFKSEKQLQKYMLSKKIISKKTYFLNVLKRWIIQVAMPSSIRGWVFRKFARNK